ncbi:major facilitator superfamily transporter [Ceratobasidium sp. AG-Ba]|nr:major facilitator superfamily transporter [Ceratobasidium sp. AG-Ba]
MSYQVAKRRVLKERARRSQSGTPTWSRAHSGTATPTLGTTTPIYAGSVIGGNLEKQLEENKAKAVLSQEQDIKLSIMDVNPIRPIWYILKQKTNICILFASGILFAFQYGICFTAALTFARAPYHFNSIKVGLVLLSFGLGNLAGSILGGRWSDHILAKLKSENGGISVPEMRLQSTKPAMVLLPLLVVGYAWMCEEHVHIAGPVVVLFFAGFGAIWIYSSTLAYIVDANPGRASSAIAANSSFRGISGLVVAEISVPLQNAIGDGGLYTIWAGLLAVCEGLILLLIWRGERWRASREHTGNTNV